MSHEANLPKLDCLGCQKAGKCCDFQPFLPNYLLGAMLEAGIQLPPAREHHYQPIGLVPDRGYRQRHALLQDGERGEEFFCVFFREGKCSVYQFRPSECRHYFCEGMGEGLHRLSQEGFEIEVRKAQESLVALGYDWSEIHRQVDVLNLLSEPLLTQVDDMLDLYRRAWEKRS